MKQLKQLLKINFVAKAITFSIKNHLDSLKVNIFKHLLFYLQNLNQHKDKNIFLKLDEHYPRLTQSGKQYTDVKTL